jgi:hypothetical protein
VRKTILVILAEIIVRKLALMKEFHAPVPFIQAKTN